MEPSVNVLSFLAGVPAIAGLILTAAIIFLTSDWRLSLTGLLVQYVLIGLVLTRLIPVEVAIVKVLVGALVVPILYLGARQIQERRTDDIRRSDNVQQADAGSEADFTSLADSGAAGERHSRVLGLQVNWAAGPLGLPLRLLTMLLVALAVIRFFDAAGSLFTTPEGANPLIPLDAAFVATWLGAMGLVGLVLSADPLRVAPALLTVLAAFDLIYAGLEPNLAIVGLLAALTLLVALAFSYLIIVQGLGTEGAGNLRQYEKLRQARALPEAVPGVAGPDADGRRLEDGER
jgi:hypothetical protein